MNQNNLWKWLRALVIGRPRELSDRTLFHRVSLVAVLAWVGLGADGLSSSCYGPEETFRALGQYPALSIFIAFACVGTIAVICASYRQIIELFPTGGGGYLVASKLLGPGVGVVSGSALLVDYVLTITISIASGADALFSLLGPEYLHWKEPFAAAGIVVMTLLNLRGVRESVLIWAPVFFLFVATHGVAILATLGVHAADVGTVATETAREVRTAHAEIGTIGILVLLLRAFAVGAGTYTGIEAVSNGLPILREPRVETGKKTMMLMGFSLAITVFGLLLAYMLQGVHPVEGKTLNAVLFASITASWPHWAGASFVFLCMTSAAALLFIAAQAGFLDGPRVLANMALDRWFPNRFASLSDRFVAQNGIVVMGAAALVTLLATHGSVATLVVLYSINVFLTFSLSQLGMVLHWWRNRRGGHPWKRRLAINGIGLVVTTFILISLCAVKFFQGGWVTLATTSVVVGAAFLIRRQYIASTRDLKRLDCLVAGVEREAGSAAIHRPAPDAPRRTAIVLVNGYNGLGVHTFLGILRMFPRTFGHYVFVQVGVVEAGTFKGAEELDRLRESVRASTEKYLSLCARAGLSAEASTDIGLDVVDVSHGLVERVLTHHPDGVVFGGKLAFLRETIWTRWLHNYVIEALQRILCRRGVAFVIVPIRV